MKARLWELIRVPPIDQIDRETDTLFLLFSFAPRIHGVTRVQKLLFLLNEETEYAEEYGAPVLFEFVPYDMGPFAVEVYEELEFLEEIDAISIEGQDKGDLPDEAPEVFQLTEKGEKIARQIQSVLDPKVRDDLREFVEKYADMDLEQLLRYVYEEYPKMAEESKISDEIYEPHKS